jgi:transcription antitermination protein NusB
LAARSKARTRALDILFEADQRGLNAETLLDERLGDRESRAANNPYTAELVRGVVGRWNDINAALTDYSQGWTLDRMPAVDRAILRIGVWELGHNPEVPVGVAIDEAVEAAKELSTDDSPRFVNGVLSAVARDVRPEG